MARFLDFLDNLFVDLFGSALRESMRERIRVESAADERTLTLKDGSLVSIIRIEGSKLQPSRHDLAELAARMRVSLAPFLSGPGHALKFTFARDPTSAERIARSATIRGGRQSARLGLDIADMLADRERRLAECLVSETCLISVHTRLFDIGKSRWRTSERTTFRGIGESNASGQCMDETYARHVTFVETLERELRNAGQLSVVLDANDAAREMRASLYPFTEPWKADWFPRLDGLPERRPKSKPSQDAIPFRPAAAIVPHATSCVSAVPPLCWQLATEDAEVVGNGIVRIGGALLAGLDVTIAPEILTPFNSLVSSITAAPSRIAWRCSLQMETGGLEFGRLKEQFTRLFAFSAPIRNGRIRDAFETLRERDGAEDTVIRLRISFAAWARLEDEADLRRNCAILRRAVESWGNSSADSVTGNPVATVLASVPGITLESTAPPAVAPLSRALAMAPLARQASPWRTGPILLRTDDGKIWPYRPGSSKQNNWVEIFAGTPGSGKSVAMNAFNLASVLDAGSDGGKAASLPRVAVIDIGHSSKGLIELIREALPPRRRHEAVHVRLKMTPEHAINVFDTCLGLRRPFVSGRSFLVNFLAVLCGDGESGWQDTLTGLVGAAIDIAYEELQDDRNPKRYIEGEEPAVDVALRESGFSARSYVSWWEVVDVLFAAGRVVEATTAQARAVPVLSDVVAASHADQVVALYGGAIDGPGGQPLLASLHRRISEAARDLPILAGPTRFNLDVARVAALDVDEITVGEGGDKSHRQASTMFMLARHVAVRDWMLDVEEVRSAVRSGHLPGQYLNHHLCRAESMTRSPKLLCMDEFHRAGGTLGIRRQVVQDIREGRKHNVRFALASQLPEDFDRSILEMASSVFVFSPPSITSMQRLCSMFGLTEFEQSQLKTRLTGPTGDGTPVFGIFRHKEGECRQLLHVTLASSEIWALSTSPEDVALRERLYRAIGPKLARQTLAARFASGSAKSEMEVRLYRLLEAGDDDVNAVGENILHSVSDELIAASSHVCPFCRGDRSVETPVSNFQSRREKIP